jgi:hypothetical protein
MIPKISLKSAPFPPIPSTTKPHPPKRKRKHNDKQIRKKNQTAMHYVYKLLLLLYGEAEERSLQWRVVCFLSLQSNGSFLS